MFFVNKELYLVKSKSGGNIGEEHIAPIGMVYHPSSIPVPWRLLLEKEPHSFSILQILLRSSKLIPEFFMSDFDQEEAKKFLLAREEKEKQRLEEIRKTVLNDTMALLKDEFQGSAVEVYLVGSILQPFQFKDHSDIDIVLKNFQGDLFKIWSKLSLKFDRTIEVILFETCHFQDFVLKNGLKVV